MSGNPYEGSATLVDVLDERTELAHETLELLRSTFPRQERHAIAEFEMELAESRMELLWPYDFHLLAIVDDDTGLVVSMGSGVYLAGVNAGLVTYLAVPKEQRGRGFGRQVRAGLVERFRENARSADWDDLAWVLGEVRMANPWLKILVEKKAIIPFDLDYYHPGMIPGYSTEKYVLYREPVSDDRRELPVSLVRKILYAIYRRAYRVRYPMQKDGFLEMLEELGDREMVGVHPDFR